MLCCHGGDRMGIKPDDNTVVEAIKARDFERYQEAVEEYIETQRRPVDDKD